MNYKFTTFILALILALLLIIRGDAIFSVQSTEEKTNTHNMNMMNTDNAGMHSMMMDMTSRMKGKAGDELDKIFLEDMVVHHQGAVDMALVLQKGTQRSELQKMAKDIIDVQTKEIDMMKTWLKNWF